MNNLEEKKEKTNWFEITIYEFDFKVKRTKNGNYFIKCNEGYNFFINNKLVGVYCGYICTFITHKNYEYRLFKIRKKDGKFEHYDEKIVKGREILKYIEKKPLLHIPKKLEPVQNVEIPKELLDE